MMRQFLIYCSLCFISPLMAQEGSTYAEMEDAKSYNETLTVLREKIKDVYEKANCLVKSKQSEADYQELLAEMKTLQAQKRLLEEEWKNKSVQEAGISEESYALWDMGETTLSQLIMEYGSGDHLYIVPQELQSMKISVYSGIPLPRESWSEMIEMILSQNGVGIRKMNPFAKQLFILKLDPSTIEGIVSRSQDLGLFASHARLFFVLSPPIEQLKSLQAFFEKFSDPKQTTVQAVGSKVVLISNRETLEKLMGLYQAVWERQQGKVIRVIKSLKIIPQEIEKVLKAFFAEQPMKGRPNLNPLATDELTVLSLPQGIVLVGEEDSVSRGEKVIADLEAQLDDLGENVIYWYTCKHSSPEDIAVVLEKVYDSLIRCNFEKKEPSSQPEPIPNSTAPCGNTGVVCPSPALSSESNPMPACPGRDVYNPILPANPPFVQPGVIDKDQKTAFGNFIVDAKTTSILMVVRREELPKIKALLKKMDVPKRMVQLDVLLIEKKLTDQRQVGFDLLQFGKNENGVQEFKGTGGVPQSIGSPIAENAVTFNQTKQGIFEYIFSRNSGSWPAVDLRFNFLLSQEDVQINSNPSALATNQTPVTLSVVEEISINNGSFQTQSGALLEQSFSRAQFGTTIVLVPTIHLAQDGEDVDALDFVTLKTNIEFDTTQPATNSRPPVTRRHVENEVCIPDGETVIIGGLKSRRGTDERSKIPFLGDLPGLGKLFGLTKQTDVNSEMFIFITPRIVREPGEDLKRIRMSEYKKRSGDIPEFLQALDEAKNQERKKMFNNSLKTLFDMY